MPRDSSGSYTLPLPPVAAGTLIESNQENTTNNDQATALTDSLSRTGLGGMQATLKLVDGTNINPATAFNSEANSGPYRAGAGDVRYAILGTDLIRLFDNGAGTRLLQVWDGAQFNRVLTSADVITEPGTEDGQTLRWEADTSVWEPTSALVVNDAGVVIVGGTAKTTFGGTRLNVDGPALSNTSNASQFSINASGTPAAGSGATMTFNVESGPGTFPFYPVGQIATFLETGGTSYAASMAFRTSNAAGTVSEAMRIDSAGNVGIGTSAPQTTFDVGGINGWGGFIAGIAASISGANAAMGNGGNLRVLSNSAAAADVGGSIAFGGYFAGQTDSLDFAEISGRKQSGQTTGGYLALGTRTDIGNIEERMRIDSAGTVLINETAALGGLLNISKDGAAGSPTVVLRANTGELSDSYIQHNIQGVYNWSVGVLRSSGSYWITPSNTLGTTGLEIDSSGKVIVADLAGTGTRDVQVLADGTLIAV